MAAASRPIVKPRNIPGFDLAFGSVVATAATHREQGSIFGRVIGVGHWNPTIVLSILSHVPDAWEVHVSEGDQIAIFRRIGKRSFPLNRGALLVNVEFDRDRRGIELHVGSVNCVAQENQFLTTVLERIETLPRRMPVRGNSAN